MTGMFLALQVSELAVYAYLRDSDAVDAVLTGFTVDCSKSSLICEKCGFNPWLPKASFYGIL